MAVRVVGFLLLFVSAAIVSVVLYRNNPESDVPLVYTPTQMLNATWHAYKDAYVSPETGRTIDRQRGDVTTSEGQSYTMLRAVWMGDKDTFDTTWEFTRTHLQHKNDALFSWLYGALATGTYGVLEEQGGATSASDADSDIALALLFAYARWHEEEYLAQAQAIVHDIWEKEVIEVDGVPYLAANDKEKTLDKQSVLINPSYLSPYSYRLFAKIDPAHPWERLVDSSYALLLKSIEAPLTQSPGALPPNWVELHSDGTLSSPAQEALTSDYGYDALRIPWRLALDWQWYQDERALRALSAMQALGRSWESEGKLDTIYSHSAQTIGNYESPAMYGGAIGYFLLTSSSAKDVYNNKLVYLYNPDANNWKQTLSYYDDNWAWFGIALYNQQLPNLAATLPQTPLAWQ